MRDEHNLTQSELAERTNVSPTKVADIPGRDAAIAHLRSVDPVLAQPIDANPDFDPRAWLAELPQWMPSEP